MTRTIIKLYRLCVAFELVGHRNAAFLNPNYRQSSSTISSNANNLTTNINDDIITNTSNNVITNTSNTAATTTINTTTTNTTLPHNNRLFELSDSESENDEENDDSDDDDNDDDDDDDASKSVSFTASATSISKDDGDKAIASARAAIILELQQHFNNIMTANGNDSRITALHQLLQFVFVQVNFIHTNY